MPPRPNFYRRDFLSKICRGSAASSINRLGFSQAASTPIQAIRLSDRVALLRAASNTHWHGDHVGSNELPGKAGVKLWPIETPNSGLSQEVKIEAFNTTIEPLNPERLPGETFAESGELTFKKKKIQHIFQRSHRQRRGGCFPSASVLQTVDLFFSGTYDRRYGGSPRQVTEGHSGPRFSSSATL